MLSEKALYDERPLPIACHCAPWPVKTKAVRGIAEVEERTTGARLASFSRRPLALEATAYDFQGNVVLLELSVNAKSLRNEGAVDVFKAR